MTGGESLEAVLLRLAGHAEHLGKLETREAAHFQGVRDALDGLAKDIDTLRARQAGHAEILASLDGITGKVAELAGHVASLLPPNPGPGYQPIPAVTWWDISDQDHGLAVARLRRWVDEIYRPHYGHLARPLGDCWDGHPLCLIQLDWLSELWSSLYLQPARTAGNLAAQAEFGTRILPAAAAQLATETRGCSHRAPQPAPRWAGAR